MLEQFLVGELFTFLLIFCRIGAGAMVLPGFGELYVSPRVRLLFALAVSAVMMPVMTPHMPPPPGSPLALAVMIAAEILTGVMIGVVSRILISAMHTAGMIIAYQSSLASAMIFDITQAGQTSVIGNFLSFSALVFLFSANIHHVMFMGLFDSYSLFAPGVFLPVEDSANYIAQLISRVFLIAVQMAAPLIAVGLALYMGAGVLARLMPNMQVFFVIIPAQILLSFFILMVVISGMMLWYLRMLEEIMGGFLLPF